MSFIHVAVFKRRGKKGLELSGVPKFAMYLNRALNGQLQEYEYLDLPTWANVNTEPDWIKARALNTWLLAEGRIKAGDTVIVDGFWGLGLEEAKDIRVISVCHGSYIGTMMQFDKYPWAGEPFLGQQMQQQEWFWQNSGCEIVAVSKQAARELKLLSNLDSTVIENGVDLEIFKPMPELRKPGLILHAATGNRKGADMMKAMLGPLTQQFRLEPLNALDGVLEHEAARWNEGSLAFFPTRYEGNSYASLDAAACGVPQVHYATGQAVDFDARVGIVTDDLHPISLVYAVREAMSKLDTYRPHEWAQEHASYNNFARAWREFLHYE